MKLVFAVLVTIYIITESECLSTTSSYLTPADKNHFVEILAPGFDSQDLPTVHFSVLGYSLLNEAFPKTDDVCKFLLNSANNGKATAEVLYQVTTTWKAYGGKCNGALPVLNSVKTLNDVLNGDPTVQDVFHALSALAALGQKPQDVNKVIKNLQAGIKKDDSLSNLGYLFNSAALLGSQGSFAFTRIEDAIVQADEVDSKYLQFEGGLSISALILSGAYKLSAAVNTAPPITSEQAVKFANYFLSRKSVQTHKGVWNLLQILQILTTNKFHLPIAVTLSSYPWVSVDSPHVNVKVSDVLGNSFGDVIVTAESVTRATDNVVIISKTKFRSTHVKGVYSLNIMESKPEKGIYKISVGVTLNKNDNRVTGSVGSTINVNVMSQIAVDYVMFGTADVHQTTQSKLDRIDFPNKQSSKLEMDTQQRLIMKLIIKDKATNEPMSVHQCFVRFYNKQNDVEVIFVMEHDSTLQYKFDLDIGAKANEFNQLSGDYSLEIILGDAVISNSLSWNLGEVSLSFASDPTFESHQHLYQPKPEIKHLFREPERRPPLLLSNIFTGLVLVPFLILLGLWFHIGINVSNFRFSISAICFHGGLATIFLLFVCFWLKLNMFHTMKYLLPLSVFTFLSGNRLLRKMAQSKK